MKILLVGDFSSNLDEGLKNIARYNYEYLKEKHKVKTLNVKHIFSLPKIFIFKNYKPDIIHYFTTPTYSAFILLKLLHFRWPESKSIISALHSKPSPYLRIKPLRLIIKYFLKPDLLLYQNNPEFFKDLSKNIIFFPNGIDIKKFNIIDKKTKQKLRLKYGIDKNKFIILHVGHLSKKRNLEIFTKIQKLDEEYQTLIVAGTYVYKDYDLFMNLKKAGCKIIVGYVKNIEEIYALSDCYIFPVPFGNTINIPLSILEALSCNMPVISFKYPSFSIFHEGDGLYFVTSSSEIPQKIKEIQTFLKKETTFNLREKILPYSFENLTKELGKIYDQIKEG